MRMASKVYAKSIPPELVFSMDETFVWLIPMGNATTFHKKGDSEVSCVCFPAELLKADRAEML